MPISIHATPDLYKKLAISISARVALAWAGRPQAHEILARIKRELPEETRKELVASRGALPEWLARAISAELAA